MDMIKFLAHYFQKQLRSTKEKLHSIWIAPRPYAQQNAKKICEVRWGEMRWIALSTLNLLLLHAQCMRNLLRNHNPLRSPNERVFTRSTGIFSFISEPFLHFSRLPFVFGKIAPCIVYHSRRKFLLSFFRGLYFSLFPVQDWVFGLTVCRAGQKVVIPRNHKTILSR